MKQNPQNLQNLKLTLAAPNWDAAAKRASWPLFLLKKEF